MTKRAAEYGNGPGLAQRKSLGTTHVVDLAHQVARASLNSDLEAAWLVDDFLRSLVDALQPALKNVMRSRRIVLSQTNAPIVALRSDGIFVHVDAAGQEDVMNLGQAARILPDLPRILDVIRDELVATQQPQRTSDALALLLQAREALSAEPPTPTSVRMAR